MIRMKSEMRWMSKIPRSRKRLKECQTGDQKILDKGNSGGTQKNLW